MDPLITVLDTRIVTGSGGGPEKTILNSPRFLEGSRYRGLACYLRSPQDPGFAELRRRAKEKDCPLIEIDDKRPLDFVALKALAEVCRIHNVRIWHGHDYKTNLFGVLLRPRLKFRLVTTVHGWVTRTSRTPFYYAIDRWTLPRHDQVIAVSDDLFEQCKRSGVAADRLHLIENAIDSDEFRRTCPPAMALSRTGMPPGRLVIGAVGRLREEKGFDLLISAVSHLLREGHDLELWIAGEGPELQRLTAQAHSTGYDARIRFLGFQASPRELFEAFDIFCLSSRREGLPNVVLEAMAMEVPVVATRSGGIEKFGRDGEDMLIVPVGREEPLKEAIRSLIYNVRMRAALARTARRRIEDEYSFRQRMNRVVEVYDRLWCKR